MSTRIGTKWFCEICNVKISKSAKARHLKSLKHINKLSNRDMDELLVIDVKYRNRGIRVFLHYCRTLEYEINTFRKTQYNLSKETNTNNVFEYACKYN